MVVYCILDNLLDNHINICIPLESRCLDSHHHICHMPQKKHPQLKEVFNNIKC